MKTTRKRNLLAAALTCGLAAGLLCAVDARAQSEESELPPALGEFEAAPLPPPEKPFLVPDVPQSVADQTQVKERWFTLKPGAAAVFDYTAFAQDAASLSQVGKQEDQWQVRDLRLMLRGTIGTDYKVNYFVAGVYKGFDSDPDTTWELVDLWFAFPLGSPATKLTVGKTKETFDYEMVGDSANLPQQERVLSPFFVSRNVGAKLSHVFGADQRMTLSGGVFNDWWTKGEALESSGTDVSARFTGLAWDQPDGKRFLHLALSGRYAGADNNTLRYKGRPESNVADNYVDTGNLPGDHAWHHRPGSAVERGAVLGARRIQSRVGGFAGDGQPGILRLLRHGQLDSHWRNAALRPHRGLRPPGHARGTLGRARTGRAVFA